MTSRVDRDPTSGLRVFWLQITIETSVLFYHSDCNYRIRPNCLFVLRFYGPVNPMGSCRARSVYLTTRLLGRLSPLSG